MTRKDAILIDGLFSCAETRENLKLPPRRRRRSELDLRRVGELKRR